MELSPRGNSGCADILPPTFVATLEWTDEEWRNDCDLKFMHNMTLMLAWSHTICNHLYDITKRGFLFIQ